jgi:hypothetical protein
LAVGCSLQAALRKEQCDRISKIQKLLNDRIVEIWRHPLLRNAMVNMYPQQWICT